jgi:hypothetical protein
LASRCGVFQNQPPADVHAFSGTFHFKPLNLVKVLYYILLKLFNIRVIQVFIFLGDLAAENAQFAEIFDLYFNQAILASRLGLGLQINLQICGFYEGLTGPPLKR